MNIELFKDSCILMVVGMGMTFSFLILLVGVMKLLTVVLGVVGKVLPEPIQKTKLVAPVVNDNKKLKIAIALAAIKAGK